MVLTVKHLNELICSAISPEMAELNFWSIQEVSEGYEVILGEYSGSRGAWEQQGIVSRGTQVMLGVYSHLDHGGWVFQGANGFCSLKPNKPRVEDRGAGETRTIKYESPFHCQHSLFMPSYTPELWEQILGNHYNPELNQEQLWEVAGTLDLEVFLTEGAKKTVAIACQGFLALGLPGKDNWRTSYKGTKRVVDPATNAPISRPNELILDVLNKFQVIYAFDQDSKMVTRKSVRASLAALSQHLTYLPFEVTWASKEGKGIDDILYSGKTMQQILETKAPFSDKPSKLYDSERAEEVASAMQGQFLHDGAGTWWSYDRIRGTWKRIPHQVVKQFIAGILGERYGKFTCSQRDNCYKLVSCDPRIFVETMGTARGLVGFTNGVLDLSHEKGFRPASPSDKLIDRLPYPYDPNAKCPKILEWLDFVSNGDEVFVATLRAFYNCILYQRFSYQKFLELVGQGGSGKGTALRLGRLLVGRDYSQELYPSHLNDRFELAALDGKKLATISDAPPTFGDMTVFRALTGEDTLRSERKGVDRSFSPDFVFQGMVMVAAHQSFGVDGSSGMMRRRISLSFSRKPEGPRRQLISILNDDEGWSVEGEFAAELPGFFNWVSLMPESQVQHLIANNGWQESSTLRAEAQEIERSGMPLLDWIFECCVVDPNATSTVGRAKYESGDEATKLYPSYIQWCEETGNHPLKLANFKRGLEQTVKEKFGLTLGEKRTASSRLVSGIAIRNQVRESVYGIPTYGRKVTVLQDGKEWTGLVNKIPDNLSQFWEIWYDSQIYLVPSVSSFVWVEWAS